jgi:tetratricopeptide (TPR) repeat protein
MDPENPDWILELSYSYNNLAALRLSRGQSINEATLAHIAESVNLMEKVVELRPENKAVADNYATTMAWAADAHVQICNLEDAMEIRQKVKNLAQTSVRADPGNNDLNRRYAYALSGGARLKVQLGRLQEAQIDLQESLSVLQQLSMADPSNVLIREQAAHRKILLAELFAETDELEQARMIIDGLKPEIQAEGIFSSQESRAMTGHLDYLIVAATVESGYGNKEQANGYLQEAMQLQLHKIKNMGWDKFDGLRVQTLRYKWWEENGHEGIESFAVPASLGGESKGAYQSCAESDFEARMYLIDGKKQKAGELVDYLRNKKYATPSFMKFCINNQLCMQES